MRSSRTNRIILQKITLQGVPIEIPVAAMTHNIPGPVILITGGVDGDEYTGIRAAYELIEHYSTQKFAGRIIILPIVNVPGFYSGKSLNPLDNKYPKYIFPGSKKGSATEQLIDWMNASFIKDASVWIDLHSGAISERLKPFIWAFETRNKKINELSKSILTALNSSLNVYEKAPFLSKAGCLASQDCIYLVFERGEKGEQKNEEIEKMVTWVKKTVNVVNGKKGKEKKNHYFEKVKYYRAQFDGMWIPSVDPKKIQKGTIVGTLVSIDGSKKDTVKVKESGEILWMKDSLFAKKGDELLVVTDSERMM